MLDSWKGMLLSLIAFVAVPGYWQMLSANDSQWGVYWFAFAWNNTGGWFILLQYAFADANSFIVNGMWTIESLLLILFALWAWKSKTAKPAVITLALSTVLLLLAVISACNAYIYNNGGGYSYRLIPTEIGFLTLLTIFTYRATLSTPAQAAYPAPIKKPTAAVVLSSIGGMVFAALGILLLVEQRMTAVGWHELVIGSLIIVGGIMAYRKQILTNAWGSAIVVLSVLAGGNLISLFGGISAMLWKPSSGVAQEPATAPVVSTTGTKYCTSCGNRIVADAKFCAHCGAGQRASKPSPAPVPQAPPPVTPTLSPPGPPGVQAEGAVAAITVLMEATEFCIHCGAKNLKGSKFCLECGTKLA